MGMTGDGEPPSAEELYRQQEMWKRGPYAPLSVRWQAQMEDHLAEVRRDTALVDGPSGLARATAGMANAVAALTLAVANTGGDLETALQRVADSVGD